MSKSINLKLRLGPQLDLYTPEWPRENLELIIPVECPYCGVTISEISTWGTYHTLAGNVLRYMCKACRRTFNPAKIPFWLKKVTELVWKLV